MVALFFKKKKFFYPDLVNRPLDACFNALSLYTLLSVRVVSRSPMIKGHSPCQKKMCIRKYPGKVSGSEYGKQEDWWVLVAHRTQALRSMFQLAESLAEELPASEPVDDVFFFFVCCASVAMVDESLCKFSNVPPRFGPVALHPEHFRVGATLPVSESLERGVFGSFDP